MSNVPNKKLHDDGGRGNGSGQGHHGQPAGSQYPRIDQGTTYDLGEKVSASIKHDYHSPHDMNKEGPIPKISTRNNDSREADKGSSLLPNMLIQVPTLNDSTSGHADAESKMEHRDLRENAKETRVENREVKSDSKELLQTARSEKRDGNVDDAKDKKLERESYSEDKEHEKLDNDALIGTNSQRNWKDHKEQYRAKQYPDSPAGKVESLNASRFAVHGPLVAAKEGLRVEEKDLSKARENVGENKIDMKVENKFKDKDGKAKEVNCWSNLQPRNCSSENKEVAKEEKDSEQWANEKEDLLKEKEKINATEKDVFKKQTWNGSDKEAPQNDIETVNVPEKVVEEENLTLELKKKDYDPKNVDRESRDKKKEREGDVEPKRPDKRIRCSEKESDEGSMLVEGGAERETEVINCGVKQRKRQLQPRGSPQVGNRDSRYMPSAYDGSQGKTDVSCVVYKVGESMQEVIKLWNEYASQADKASGNSQNGPTLEIRIPAKHVTTTNRQVRGVQLWGTDIYTVDSDLVAVLMHTGYYHPTASKPPSVAREFRATVRVMPPQECYISTLRNNVRSRSWRAAIGCSYRVERCCIVKKGGGSVDLVPRLTHSSTMEPTLAPLAVECRMTTRAAASNALRQQRFMRGVTTQFNLCMEPWLKYSINAVADKGFERSLFASARLKKGEVLYVETHFRRYELCFNGEKPNKAATASQGYGAETVRIQNHIPHHLANGEKNGGDTESVTMDTFRWSRCKKPLPQKTMLSIGIPLPLELMEVLEENLDWEEIGWSPNGVWVAGKEYRLARAHFLAPN